MKTLNYLAAALLIGGSVLVGCNKDETSSNPPTTQPSQTPGQAVGKAIDKTTQSVSNAATQVGAAISPTGADSLMGVKKAIQGVAENATDKGNFKDVAGYFTKADEDRIDKTKPDTKDLDDQIDAFQKAWKAKYNHDFKVKDLNVDYPDTFLTVAQDSADANRAAATIAASHGMPEIKVPVVREGSLWKIDVPDEVDGAVLHTNLVTALTALNKDQSGWSANEADAVQAVTHHIIAAVMNKM